TLQLYNIHNIAEVNVILPNSNSNNIEKLIIVRKEQVTIKRHVKSNLMSKDLTSEATTQELTLR
ncbi:10539_t:CDS:1, partial [Funneliformis geosporum]